MKIVHIINSLKKGGAEGNLYRLSQFQKKKFKKKIDIIIVTLIDHGFYETQLKKNGIKVYSLGFDKKLNILKITKKIFKLRNFIINENPDIIQSWMYHSNFISLFLPRIFYEKILWNIRHSELNFKISKKKTILISIICGLFSKFVPKKIIYCSEKSIEFHEKNFFYAKHKTILIDNGFDEKNYFESNHISSNFRNKNKINKSHIILGFAGRYAKQKNINGLLIAFSRFSKRFKNVHLCMVGKNINSKNDELNSIVLNLNIKDSVHFLNEQKNLLEFYNGIDLLVLPSFSESFPNVIAESMLCATPVLSSNAGCAKKIIGASGFIMRNNDHQSILNGLIKSIKIFRYNKNKWNILKKNSQQQIKKNFSIAKMSNKYLRAWIFK